MVEPMPPPRQADLANLAPWQRRDAAHITQICAIPPGCYRGPAGVLPGCCRGLMPKHGRDIRARNRPAGAAAASSPLSPRGRSRSSSSPMRHRDDGSGRAGPDQRRDGAPDQRCGQIDAGIGPLPPAAGMRTGSNGTAPGLLASPPSQSAWRRGAEIIVALRHARWFRPRSFRAPFRARQPSLPA